MKALAVALVVAGILTPAAKADDADLARRLRPTVKAAARAAGRAGHSQLLVVVRPMEGSDAAAGSGLIEVIHQSINDALEAEGLTAESSDAAEQRLGAESDKQVLEPEQVAAVQQETPCDAIVAANVNVQGLRTAVRIALVDAERRLFVRTVRLADRPAKPQAAGLAIIAAGGGTGNSIGVPGGLIPPLSDGFSGYSKGAAGNAANAAAANGGNTAAGGAARKNGEAPTALNRRIVQFATGRIGEQVGNGECWTLAAEALAAAGAQPPRMYDFGQEIKLSELTPGDILQFTSARFDLPGGGYLIMGAPNHTAIVYALNGEQVFILHQNFGKKIVTTLDIRFDQMTKGEVQAYRAVGK